MKIFFLLICVSVLVLLVWVLGFFAFPSYISEKDFYQNTSKCILAIVSRGFEGSKKEAIMTETFRRNEKRKQGECSLRFSIFFLRNN